MPTIWAIDNIENKNISYRGENCMKKVFESLKEQAKNIIDFEKKKMQPLTKEKTNITSRSKSMLYLWKKNSKKFSKDKIIKKSEIITILQVNIEVQHIVFVIFHNGSNYDYRFIVKDYVYEFEGQFECLGENTEECYFYSNRTRSYKY